jgi:NADH-quinone oxidoreductase subunit H
MTAETVDQVFVLLKHWIVNHTPAPAQTLVSLVVSVVPILAVFPALFAVTTILERKGLGRIQNRYGPNRVGPWGIFQPIADGVKALTKEDIVPASADKLVHYMAPLVIVMAAFLAYSVLPIGRNMVLANLDAGVLFYFALSSLT